MNRFDLHTAPRRPGPALKTGAGVAALTVAALAAGIWTPAAQAQSTASQLDEIIVTGSRAQPAIGGLIQAENVPKSRSTVTQEYLSTQSAGQSVLSGINLLPGVSFTNNDPFGSSGGTLHMRGFDGARVSLTFDGIPLNDTGNYAMYSNQQIDEELISKATVNSGTTDVDSPTASATGGTINVQTRKPLDEPNVAATLSFGSLNFRRIFGVIDTGDFGPGNRTSAFLSASDQEYDKFKGPGDLHKLQVNGRLYEDLGGGDFISVAANYNENRNYSFNTTTKANIAQNYFYDEGTTWVPQTARPGVKDTPASGSGNPPVPTGDSNYYGLYRNPSNTGNIRGQSRLHLDDDLMLTVDPYIQYTLANGGGQRAINENDIRLIGSANVKGRDLNGDGDTLDTVLLYAPNNTNTFRTGVTSSLIWDINEDNRLRVGYTLDYGRHRQTGDLAYLDPTGQPYDVFGSKFGNNGVYAADGTQLKTRDRYSVAELNQASLEYVYKAFDQKLTVVPALRLPFFHRELNQYCNTYSTLTTAGTYNNGGSISSSALNSNQFCTSGPLPISKTAVLYSAPYKATKDYSEPLPSLGVTYQFTPEHQAYFQFSEGFSAPRTDNLYNVVRDPQAVEPEKTYNVELGYRYQTRDLMGSFEGWYTKYDNRIVSALDPTDTSNSTYIDRSLGSVELYGLQGELGYQVTERISLYTSGSWTHSEVLNDITSGGTTFHTAGKMLVDTPEWMFSARVEYKPIDILTAALDVKYTGERAASDINDEKTTPFTVMNFYSRLDLPDFFGFHGGYLQFNVNNLLDKRYLNTISSTNNSSFLAGAPGNGAAKYYVGAPRTFMGSIHAEF